MLNKLGIEASIAERKQRFQISRRFKWKFQDDKKDGREMMAGKDTVSEQRECRI